MPFALRLLLDVDHAGLRELPEALGQDGARYERRGAEQLAEAPGAEAQLPQDDGGPTVAEDFGRFRDGAELGVGDHGRYDVPSGRIGASTFYVLERRRAAATMARVGS